ncbi:hypothetical protein EAH79_08750 [Sphingomonas koreensis]|nr:hypothetical protein EAH79_08750 [Sphingomonas koreensis]
MDRSEKTGIGVAIAGHVILFGLLSVGFLATPNPMKLRHDPMDVTLATEAALESAAPQISQSPAQSQAPDVGAPEEAPPPAPQPIARDEAQPAPRQPAAAPPPKPAEVAKPQPKKTAPPAPKAAKAPAKPAPAPAKAAPAPTKAQGNNAAAAKPRTRGSHLGPDFLKGISAQASKSQDQAPKAATVGAQDLASIAGLIRRQVLPCYDLGSLKGTSAMQIVTMLRLQFRRDGSISAVTVGDQSGVNADNRSYARQIGELSRRAVLRCSPLKGLPPALYTGGWDDFDMRFTPSDFG